MDDFISILSALTNTLELNNGDFAMGIPVNFQRFSKPPNAGFLTFSGTKTGITATNFIRGKILHDGSMKAKNKRLFGLAFNLTYLRCHNTAQIF